MEDLLPPNPENLTPGLVLHIATPNELTRVLRWLKDWGHDVKEDSLIFIGYDPRIEGIQRWIFTTTTGVETFIDVGISGEI